MPLKQTVYAFLGDGEMDEPESQARSPSPPVKNWTAQLIAVVALACSVLTAVAGNGKIVNELEGIFAGGWNVIKS